MSDTSFCLLDQNKVVVRQLFETIDRQDFDTFRKLMSPECVCHVAGVPEALPLEVIIQVIQSFYEAFPDNIHSIKDMIAESDKVAVRFIQNATHKGEYEGIAPTGKEIEWEAMFFFKVADGKIMEGWILEDNLGQMRQLGMELKTKEK
jgi:steroid delta-isomerase-like uncharacterized protein